MNKRRLHQLLKRQMAYQLQELMKSLDLKLVILLSRLRKMLNRRI
uniref:Uncharacterized protein n=1 Tax=Picea sitchensis TaxID=3332 RepID=A9P2H3_PICSI|nr:unknown [Picea sitchensis]